MNALSADPHRFVERVKSKLAEHGCDEKLVPPKTAIDKYGREKRDAMLREQIQAAIDEYLEVETLIGPICNALKSRIDIKRIPSQMNSWAADLPPEHWAHHVCALVREGVDALSADIREKVAAALRDVLS
jgi:hypothetical protein